MMIFPNQTRLVPVSLEKRAVDSRQANKVVNMSGARTNTRHPGSIKGTRLRNKWASAGAGW